MGKKLSNEQSAMQPTTDDLLEYHVPVLLKESIDGLNIKADGTYVDCTFGGGGHSRADHEVVRDHGDLVDL